MARDTTDETPIASMEDLSAYLAAGCRPEEQFLIGTEHEKFAFYFADNSPVPYEGDKGIAAILERMREELGWEAIEDDGRLIGLAHPQGGGAISLEPGGQFELSGAPLQNLHDTCRESNRHLALVRKIAEPMGIRFLGLGGSPKWTRAEVPRMPKSRYDIMADYMPEVGEHGLDMMLRTTTIQVNLDFSSEADMRRKMQIGLKLQPVATALFANSPFTEGKPNGLLSWRSEIWRDTDKARTGMLPFAFAEDFGFADYVDWAVDVPMYFVLRAGHYHPMTHMTFRQFMNGDAKGQIPDPEPTMGDWTNHLSTLFPEVRLKRFIEMRGADGGPWRRICALPAFWVGLLYDREAMAAAFDLTADWSVEECQTMRDEVPKTGLQTHFRGKPLMEMAKMAVSIAETGLKNRHREQDEANDETIHLQPLREVLARGTTSAEELLRSYHGSWKESVEPVFKELAY